MRAPSILVFLGLCLLTSSFPGFAKTAVRKPVAPAARATPAPAPAPAAKPAPILIDYAKNADFCKQMLVLGSGEKAGQEWKLQFPDKAQSDLAAEAWIGANAYASFRSRNHFELGPNDADSTVYGLHLRTTATFADIYFFDPAPGLDDSWQEVEDQALFKQSAIVFPDSFSNVIGECKTANCEGQFSIRAGAAKSKSFAFRLRYLQATPFVLNNTTYFLLTSADVQHRHLAAVVAPHRTRTADEVCVFRKQNGELLTLQAKP